MNQIDEKKPQSHRDPGHRLAIFFKKTLFQTIMVPFRRQKFSELFTISSTTCGITSRKLFGFSFLYKLNKTQPSTAQIFKLNVQILKQCKVVFVSPSRNSWLMYLNKSLKFFSKRQCQRSTTSVQGALIKRRH